MKNKCSYTLFFTGILLVFLIPFYSCEKVITLNLKRGDQHIVVQGNITNINKFNTVNLNYTVPYYNDNNFPAITGAHAIISDDQGNSETLTETASGVYKTTSLTGTPGRKYTLEIVANGNTYTSISYMPLPVAIDSLTFEPSISRSSTTINGYRVICKFTDPVGLGNFYRVTINSNDSSGIGENTSRIVSDKFTDGQQLSVTFRTKLILSDTVNIELQSIDKSTYDFYNTLNGAIGSSNLGQFLAALPANPTSNISNSGLGYFSAYSLNKLSAIIK